MPRRADGTRPQRFALAALVIAALVAGVLATLGAAVGTHAPNAIAAPAGLPTKGDSSPKRPSVPNDDAFVYFSDPATATFAGEDVCAGGPPCQIFGVDGTIPKAIEMWINPGQ